MISNDNKNDKNSIKDDNENILINKKRLFEDENVLFEDNKKYKISKNDKEENVIESDDKKEKNNEENDESDEEKLDINIKEEIEKDEINCEEKNKPKTTEMMLDNNYIIRHKERLNTELINTMYLKDLYDDYYSIVELNNGNIFMILRHKFYYFDFKSYKQLKIDESLTKYFSAAITFLYSEVVNDELIGIITEEFVLIIQYNKNEVKFFQIIEIKAKFLGSFDSGNLIIFNERNKEEDKKNILHYYIYDEKLKYKFESKEEIKFDDINKDENIDDYELYNSIANIKKLDDTTYIFFTQSSIPHEEVENKDANSMSFYERDYDLTLKIYLYENKTKKLNKIYEFSYKLHCIYSDPFFPENSEYSYFLKTWNNENIYINENDEIIFFLLNCSIFEKVNIKSNDLSKSTLFNKMKNVKSFFYDKKTNLFYIEKADDITFRHQILVYEDKDKINLINKIYSPYFLVDCLRTKSGKILGVTLNTVTYYEYSYLWGDYVPTKRDYLCLCSLKPK